MNSDRLRGKEWKRSGRCRSGHQPTRGARPEVFFISSLLFELQTEFGRDICIQVIGEFNIFATSKSIAAKNY